MNEGKSERDEREDEASVGLPRKGGRGVAKRFCPAKAAFRLTPSSPSSQSRSLGRRDCRGCGSQPKGGQIGLPTLWPWRKLVRVRAHVGAK